MQLKKNKSVSVAIAASSLLGVAHIENVSAEEAGWSYDSMLSNYSESDDRIQVTSLKLLGGKEKDEGISTTIQFGVDSISGSSPTGAVSYVGSAISQQAITASSVQPVDTYTKQSASRNPPPAAPAPAPKKTTSASPQPVAAPVVPVQRDFPLFGEVEDTRVSASINWMAPADRLNRTSAGFSWSSETDYRHLGVNYSNLTDFNQKNSTFSMGLGYAYDTVHGVAGNPNALSSVFSGSTDIGEQTKQVADALLGLTQVISKNVVGQFNYTISLASGYLNDPYKVVSIVDNLGRPVDHLYESRPDTRLSHAFYSELRVMSPVGVIKPSYRFYTSDWGINSHTLGLSYRFKAGKRFFIEPNVRFYSQSQSDFYRLQLNTGERLPGYVSSDYRLAEFSSINLGMRIGSKTRKGNRWSIGMDYYRHIPEDEIGSSFANQVLVDQNLEAIILRGSFKFY